MNEGVSPERGESFTFKVTEEDLLSQPIPSMLNDLTEKLRAEDDRLRRLLPDPPVGKVWVADVQRMDDKGFADNSVYFRTVYRLEG